MGVKWIIPSRSRWYLSQMNSSILKKLYVSGLSLLRADRSQIARLLRSKKIVVLNFHRVSVDMNPFWPAMQPSVFEEFTAYLSKHFHVCLLAELGEIKTEKPLAVLSFDDGYYDFVEYALPIISKYGMSANLNIIPECAESGRPIWNVRLYDLLRESDVELINRIQLPGFDVRLRDNDLRTKLRYGLAISRFLKNRPRREREELWTHIEPLFNGEPKIRTRMLTTDEIRQLPSCVELGVHSYSHESMGYESDDFFTADFEKCESYFLNSLNLPVSIYAFPNGSYKPSQVDLLRSRGVKHILLVDEEFAEAERDVLTRKTVYGESLAEVRTNALIL